ncbi:MAG: N-formylglutamate amidohydrolase [Rhodobacteraceae bacterium]|nr:N-formylglutamate amidohydrolase [Paracoccaceae bacterium]
MKAAAIPRSCAVFSSPHSGADYPAGFLHHSCLSPLLLRSSEDAFVDRFFPDKLDAPVLLARYPRAYVDLNREAGDLDPAIIYGAAPQLANRKVAAGLGVIPRVVANGRAIQLGKIPLHMARARLEEAYYPYHGALQGLIEEQKARFGRCILFDFHSMPRSALGARRFLTKRPEVILGDRYGTSCDHWISDAVAGIFNDAGFSVARNVPFAGGYITRHYGKPHRGVHAIQVEIDRSLYMDEKRIIPRAGFAEFQARLTEVVVRLADILPAAQGMAAE